MSWEKKGLIFTVDGNHEWNKTHAQCPVVDVVDDKVWRIYYATRNAKSQSQISYIEVEAGNPENILYKHSEYLFDFGKLGTFDESGLMPSSIVTDGTTKYLYYIGWNVKKHVPYHNSIGLAKSTDNGKTFTRMFEGSIMPSTYLEPYFTGTSYVIKEEGVWRMWYLSCTKWEIINEIPEPFYHLKYAESKNGIDWERQGTVAIDFKTLTEGGIASASVLKEDNIYKMWYAYRDIEGYRDRVSKSFRIGYAESHDGISWQRLDDKIGIDLSKEGWDNFMMSYPNVIHYKNKKYMFYNGNGFGQSGFGYAIQN
ncbi:glycoside hydrolase family protein [Winogradskyella immobilis]|uniref:Glycosyl hydrolase family 32 N-terminal domain-containing protein n=1 Tax=Winogradskyella immobilis TaxID=2816852 RepID=A0ABS8EP72_9FLAO|nr:hypothetical protein [Winogradskyella immobilis]MCC1484905.1 hypothetical protein [Winogradskyella immobilis]MCG0016997.1 hypothetical protein [Winogradskyella immobilis]